MKTKTSGDTMRTGVGVMVGGMVGFAFGLLLAPDPGQRTRRRLVYQLENLALRAGFFVERLFRRSAGSDARRTGDALVADAQERAQRIRADIDVLLEEMRRQSEKQAQRAPQEPAPSSE